MSCQKGDSKMKKDQIVKNSGTYRVLKLLSDGKIHLTTEIPKPPRTRSWPTAPAETRHKWFCLAEDKGYITHIKPYSTPCKWQITEKGIKILKAVK